MTKIAASIVLRLGAAAITTLIGVATANAGASLDVAPVLIDVAAPGASGTVSVRNNDDRPTTIQVRLFKWRQTDGDEHYEPTDAVVASPPIASVAPGASLTVRVIRAADAPADMEESYRLVLDQLPEADRNGRARVAMLLRQVIPVFFAPANREPPSVDWRLTHTAKGWALQAHNRGEQRLRVAQVTLAAPGRPPLKLGGGLLGYVLAHADMGWTLGRAAGFRSGEAVTVRGESDHGPFRATASVAAAP